MIIIDIRRRWDPRVAQTCLLLPGGREYNGFLIGEDNNRYKEDVGPPCRSDKPHVARGFIHTVTLIDVRALDIRKRRWNPCAAQTGFILPGGRKYNDFLIGDDNNNNR